MTRFARRPFSSFVRTKQPSRRRGKSRRHSSTVRLARRSSFSARLEVLESRTLLSAQSILPQSLNVAATIANATATVTDGGTVFFLTGDSDYYAASQGGAQLWD